MKVSVPPSPPPKAYNTFVSEEKYRPLISPYHPLKHLAVLRHGYKDKIPPEILHSIDKIVSQKLGE